MEKQVLTIKQMKELQELGINTSKASMIWEYKGQYNEYKDYYNLEIFDYTWEFVTDYDVPTFTLQDILEMLPKRIDAVFKDTKYGKWDMGEVSFYLTIGAATYYYSVSYDNDNLRECHPDDNPSGMYSIRNECNENLLLAAFNMLKWCKENGHI